MIRTATATLLILFAATAATAVDNAAPAAPQKTEVPAAEASASSPAAAAAASTAISAAGSKTDAKADTAPPAKPFVYRAKTSDVVTGKADAPVTIVEYASLSCPHCSHFFINTLPQLATKYIDTGKAKLVFRSFPLNDPALKAAELVQCVPAESREAFVKVLFKEQMKWAYETNYRAALSTIAVMGGFDALKFEACMNDKEVEKTVLGVAKEAQDDYRVTSTPTFFVNGEMEKGMHDLATLGKMIDFNLAAQDKK
jgi:protein-disulfide isomerase